MTGTQLSSTRLARKERILDAAEAAFRAEGFRGTSVEGIAARAGMSKVTVYSYFPDKEAAFSAVAERFAQRLQQGFDHALAQPGRPSARVAAALIAKHSAVAETVRNTGFARDLFDARDRLSSDMFRILDDGMIRSLAELLAKEKHPTPERAARLLFASADGIANSGVELIDLKEDITWVVSSVLKDF